MAHVQLKHVYKRFANGVVAVQDFDLQIEDGEFLVLVGPSGCGKTTTLRMIAGLASISEGELWIGDRLVNDVHPKDRDIAMVFQNYGLYPHLTAYDNMAFGLKLRKTPKAVIEEKVREAAQVLNIEHLLARKPKALSGGQRQRVALGRAIVREPQVFLMDEPLSNLDALLRAQLRTEIAKLHQRMQATVIYVTHDQTEAMTMGTRIVVMKEGVVQQVGTPQDVYNRPQNMFVASFIGAPAMNFLSGRLQVAGDEMFFQSASFQIAIPVQRQTRLREAGALNMPLILGIRPEDLIADQDIRETTDRALLPAAVERVELLGAEKHVHLRALGQSMIARVPARSEIEANSSVTLTLLNDRIHLFDALTEESIF
ncbi:ABC transporter ATP-binding protein [Tumebacillus lipolyticus]|uniref:ABC transporter ATP-binding protein n=1 Tax=Tumebacillus lipolyticus TaxID=1280370 RepID=A0ABW4ZWA4_9BACL